MGTILGIDLGTTNSLCSVFSDGEPRLIPNSSGSFLTPSVVGLLEGGEVIVGDAAQQLAITRPERCAAFFKRSMGTDKTLELGDKTFTPQELSSLVLRSLREDAAEYLGADVVDAVVTVPAYFNDLQREATRAAAELAGLRVRRMVNEPTAAALTYGLLERDSDKRVLVIDLGGGTFDVTLLEIFEGTLEIISTAGQNHLGGEDFTDRLAVLVLQSQDLQLETEEFKNPLRVARLRMECEHAKRQLTTVESASIRIPSADGTFPDEPERFEIDRATFAQACDRLVDRLGGPIERALRDGRTRTTEVDEVILVGGATRMPVVREFVTERISREPLCTLDPDLIVGMGASVQAALIVDDSAVDDLVMTDVCPFTLGVEISKLIGTQVRDGYYLPVIHRNTTIPVSKEEIVSTLHTNQAEVLVRVHQGEARRAEDNLLLGTLKVTGIPPGPPGLPISLRFTYDGNGMLEVEAIIEQTGKRFSTVFTHNVRGLSAEALERARKELDSLKFYPRDEIEHRRLLLFAEAAVGRVAMHWRSELEEAVDVYENELNGTDPEAFAAARSILLQRLSLLGDPFDTQEDSQRDD